MNVTDEELVELATRWANERGVHFECWDTLQVTYRGPDEPSIDQLVIESGKEFRRYLEREAAVRRIHVLDRLLREAKSRNPWKQMRAISRILKEFEPGPALK